MGTISVIVVPVAAAPLGRDRLHLAARCPGGRWAERPLPARSSPNEVAHDELRRLCAQLPGVGADHDPPLSAVGFHTDDASGTKLIYTAPLPLSATMLDQELRPRDRDSMPAGWSDLYLHIPDEPTSPRARQAWLDDMSAMLRARDPIALAVLDHWRDAIEETTAVFDLLPRYFTTPQVRAVYSAVWGREQDPGNFHKWLHIANEGICRERDLAVIKKDLEARAASVWESTVLADSAPQISISSLTVRLVGTSPWALGSLSAIDAFTLPVTIAAGSIAFQAEPSRGKQPQWYQGRSIQRSVLKALYSPRPAWRPTGLQGIGSLVGLASGT